MCPKAVKLDTTWGRGYRWVPNITAAITRDAGHGQRPGFQLLPSGSLGSDGSAETLWLIQRWSAPLLWLSCCSVYWLSRAPTCSWSLNGLGRKLDRNQARYWGTARQRFKLGSVWMTRQCLTQLFEMLHLIQTDSQTGARVQLRGCRCCNAVLPFYY